MLGTVALFEHDAKRAQYLEAILQDEYLAITVCSDIDKTIPLPSNGFDLVLVPSVSPNTCGYKLCSTLRRDARFCDSIIILYAPRGKQLNWQNAFCNRIDDAFSLNDTKMQITARINRHLRKRRARKANEWTDFFAHRIGFCEVYSPFERAPVTQKDCTIAYWGKSTPSVDLLGLKALGKVKTYTKLPAPADLTVIDSGKDTPARCYQIYQKHQTYGAVIAISADASQLHQRLSDFGVGAVVAQDIDPWELAIKARQLLHEIRNNHAQKQAIQNAIIAGRIDSTTKVLNKSVALQTMNLMEQNIPEQSLGVIMVDIDYFKAINDRFGHIIGDRILAAFAHKLKQRIRAHDILARFGGDEFLIVLPAIRFDHLRQIVARLQNAPQILRLPQYGIEQIPVSFSIGFAYGRAAQDDLLRQADDSLMQEKALRHSAAINAAC